MNQSEVDWFQTNKKKFFVLLATMYLSVYFGQWMIHRKIRVFSLWINTRFVTTIVVVTNCSLIKVGQQKKPPPPSDYYPHQNENPSRFRFQLLFTFQSNIIWFDNFFFQIGKIILVRYWLHTKTIRESQKDVKTCRIWIDWIWYFFLSVCSRINVPSCVCVVWLKINLNVFFKLCLYPCHIFFVDQWWW